MTDKPVFSIRLKILVTLLLVVTGVVSVITVSMGSMFHDDKKTSIHDLTSVIALSTAEDCHAILDSYRERLKICGRTMMSDRLTRGERKQLLSGFFQEFHDLVAIVVEDGKEKVSVFDTAALDPAGLTKEMVLEDLKARPLPAPDLEGRGAVVENRRLAPDLTVLAMAVRMNVGEESEGLVVTGLIRLDRIRRLSSRSTAFEVFVLDHRGILLAHPDASLLEQETPYQLDEAFGNIDERYSAGMTLEYERDGTEMIVGLAGANFGGVSTGVQIPKTAAYLASRQILNRLVVLAFGLLVLAAGVSLVGARRITRPVDRLVTASRALAKGQFDVQVQVESNDEIGVLSRSFNLMAGELHDREVSLKEAHGQLIQSEKLAAFGQLGAGVAHEVKNPLAGILACAQLSLRKVEDETPIHRNLSLIIKETKRCSSILDNLLRFARQEKAVLEPMEINPVAEAAIEIVDHQLRLHGVNLQREFADNLPFVRGNANQLQQVLMNLMMNAQQAMGEGGGHVTLTTRETPDGAVEIRVTDDGPGIPVDIQRKVFEPFFTTKPSGSGTGLGLSVSYGIIQDHGGDISIESRPGEGATFVIRIPATTHAAGQPRQLQPVVAVEPPAEVQPSAVTVEPPATSEPPAGAASWVEPLVTPKPAVASVEPPEEPEPPVPTVEAPMRLERPGATAKRPERPKRRAKGKSDANAKKAVTKAKRPARPKKKVAKAKSNVKANKTVDAVETPMTPQEPVAAVEPPVEPQKPGAAADELWKPEKAPRPPVVGRSKTGEGAPPAVPGSRASGSPSDES